MLVYAFSNELNSVNVKISGYYAMCLQQVERKLASESQSIEAFAKKLIFAKNVENHFHSIAEKVRNLVDATLTEYVEVHGMLYMESLGWELNNSCSPIGLQIINDHTIFTGYKTVVRNKATLKHDMEYTMTNLWLIQESCMI